MRTAFLAPLAALVLCLALSGISCKRTRTTHVRLVVNEIMASNGSFLSKDWPGLPADARVPLDWVEIFNPNAFEVSLAGYALTDDLDRGSPYLFPHEFTLAPRGRVVVSFAGGGDRDEIAAQGTRAAEQLALASADVLVAEGRLDGAPGDPMLELELALARAERAEAEAFLAEVRAFTYGPFHADFGLSASRETIYLLADGEIVDEARVLELPEDRSNGRSPDGSSNFGLQLRPTPGAANGAIGVAPSFPVGGEPSAALCVEEGRSVPIDFTLVQDHSAGLPFVRLRYASTSCDPSGVDNLRENCDLRFDGEGEVMLVGIVDAEVLPPIATSTCLDRSERVPGDGLDAECLAAERVSGGQRTTRTLQFRALLPPGRRGDNVQWRLEIADDLGELVWCRCYTYGDACLPLVISEYQPRNSRTVEFLCETCTDGTRERAPDWFEVRNVGDEPISLERIGVGSRNAFRDPVASSWSFRDDTRAADLSTPGDPDYAVLGPGECRLVLADSDGGRSRRIYRRLVTDEAGGLVPDPGCRYYSTTFALDPVRGGSPDEFSLIARLENGPVVIDRAILDFEKTALASGMDPLAETFLVDLSAGRFPELDHPDGESLRDLYPPFDLVPGRVTACPTPAPCRGAGFACDNEIDCEMPRPRVLDELIVTIVDAAESWRRCPREGESVRVVAWVALDPRLPFDVALVARSAAGELVLREGDPGVLFAPDPTRNRDAPSGLVIYRLEATFLPPGAGRVDLAVRIRDANGATLATLDSTSSRSAASFSFATIEAGSLSPFRIDEALPRNSTIVLPGFSPGASGSLAEYIELSSDADVPLEIGGWYLAHQSDPEAPIRAPRRWRIPEGTVVAAGGRLLAILGARTPEGPGAPASVALGVGDLDDLSGAIYLVSPDSEGNCVVARFVYAPADGISVPDRSFGTVCDAPDLPPVRLTPTPGESNVLPPRIVDVYHSPNRCTEAAVTLSALVLVDRSQLVRAGWSGAQGDPAGPFAAMVLPRVTLRLSAGTALATPQFADTAVPAGFTAPRGYKLVRAFQAAFLPSASQVEYRFEVEDRCGRVASTCEGDTLCRSISTAGPRTAGLRFSELNRNAPVPGSSGVARRWVEIENTSEAPIDLAGTGFTNDPLQPFRITLPPGAIVPAGGTLVILTDGGAPLAGPEAPPSVVVALDWLPTRKGDVCGIDPSQPENAPPPIGLWLFDTVGRGQCALDVVDPVLGLRFPNPVCSDGTSLGRAAGEFLFRTLDAPGPGEPRGVGVEGELFVRGDADLDRRLTVSDPVHILQFLFAGGPGGECLDALDGDDSGQITIADPVFLLGFLFRQGTAPPAPWPDPGRDPTDDAIGCERGLVAP